MLAYITIDYAMTHMTTLRTQCSNRYVITQNYDFIVILLSFGTCDLMSMALYYYMLNMINCLFSHITFGIVNPL